MGSHTAFLQCRARYFLHNIPDGGPMLNAADNGQTPAFPESKRALQVERRELYRRDVDWPVVIARSTGDLLACHVLDISNGGLRLRSAHAFAPGSFLRLQLNVPGAGQVILRSRVCYQVLESDSIITGVRFENPSAEQMALLQAAVLAHG
jgi:hypothetical protein